MTMTEPANKPIKTNQFDRVTVAIFYHPGKAPENEKGFYSAQIHRRYQDSQNNWQSTSTFNERDMPHLELAARWAREEIRLLTEG
jgi:hypothetical protein